MPRRFLEGIYTKFNEKAINIQINVSAYDYGIIGTAKQTDYPTDNEGNSLGSRSLLKTSCISIPLAFVGVGCCVTIERFLKIISVSLHFVMSLKRSNNYYKTRRKYFRLIMLF